MEESDSEIRSGHFVVAVSGSGNSRYLIKWTAATASRVGSPWTAIHVSPRTPDPSPETLRENLELARELGGEVFTVPDDDIARSIISYARIKKASTIVIGKSEGETMPFIGRKPVMDAIIRESGDIDVVSLRGKTPIPAPRRGHGMGTAKAREIPIALGSVAAVTAVGLIAQPALGYRSVSILYLLAIVALPFACGRLAVLAAAMASALCWNFLFIPPHFTFSIASLEDALMFTAFFAAAIAGGYMTTRLKEKEAALATREKRAALLYGFTRALTRAHGMDDIAATVRDYLGERLACDIDIVRGDSPTGNPAEWREESPGALRVPLRSSGSGFGLLTVIPRNGRTIAGETRELVEAFADNVALALERESLTQERERLKLAEESARLSKTLLDHVSHELKTPLTAVKGALGGILGGDGTEKTIDRMLLAEALKAADALTALVENLLAMSRVEAGSLRLRKERCYVTELVGAARETLSVPLDGRAVSLSPDIADIEVFADPALAVQVFRNLLANFAAHAGPDATLSIGARPEGNDTAVIFADDGPGVDGERLGSIFLPFRSAPQAAGGKGCGLGLSICKGIVSAHGGSIKASNEAGGGFRVELRFPGES